MLGYYELFRDETHRTMAWRAQNNQFIAHFHSTIELMYVEEGVLSAFQNGVTTLVPAGHLIVNSSYMVHSCTTPTHSRIIIVTIPLSQVPTLRAILTQNSFQKGIADVRGLKECRRIMRMMADPAHQNNIRFINSLGEALLALLIEKIGLSPNENDAGSDLVKQILTYINENTAKPLTVSSVAAVFGYSAGRFSHIFNQRIGCTFTRYLNSQRCRMAKRMLESGGVPLSEVAAAAGFGSIRHFHRVYKDYVGVTPGEQGRTSAN